MRTERRKRGESASWNKASLCFVPFIGWILMELERIASVQWVASDFVFFGGYAEFLQLVAKGVAADFEQLGGVCLVAVSLAHGQLNHGVFQLLERRSAFGDVQTRKSAPIGQLASAVCRRGALEEGATA